MTPNKTGGTLAAPALVLLLLVGGIRAEKPEPLESRSMLFDHGQGYRSEIPGDYGRVFDADARFPKPYQTIFFSPGQPKNAWGEPSMTYHDGVYYLWIHNSPFPGSASFATSKDGVYWREEGYTLIPDADSGKCIGESEIYRSDKGGFLCGRTASGRKQKNCGQLLPCALLKRTIW